MNSRDRKAELIVIFGIGFVSGKNSFTPYSQGENIIMKKKWEKLLQFFEFFVWKSMLCIILDILLL